jgi:DNA/RNA endonuclease YhcR with UshA esterase domain
MRIVLLTILLLIPAHTALAQAPASAPVVTPAQAVRLVDKRVTLLMEVKSTGGTLNCYLNSAANFQDAGNFAVFIPEDALEKFKQARIEKPKDFYKGKMVQVVGTVTLFKDKPQIRVDDPAHIKVVERR